MEQIVVYNRAGKVKTKLYATSKLCAVKSAEQKRVLLGEDTLQIQTESVEPLDLQIGDYCIMYGSQYTLNAMPEPTKEGEHQYKTYLTFEGIQYKLIDVQYRNKDVLGNNTSGSFTLMADLALAMQVLINCLNSHAKAEGSGEVWMLGDCPNTEYKELTFSNENCLAVLQRLCGEDLFNIEFEIEPLGNKQYKLHLRKAGSVFPAAFTFGKGGGVYELKRKNVDSKNVVTRLYVEGGTRNITTKYRNGAQRLRLDGESYIQQEKPVAAMGIKEGAKQFDDIYPHRKGTVTAAGASIFEFVDSSMFDLNKKDSEGNTEYLQDNTPAKVKFLTGGCAGYELEITKYDHATKTFKVKAYEDSRGWKIPSQDSEAYRIAKGDTYVLLDIIMPHDPYVTDAEKELLEQGTKYYEKNSQPRVEYELTIKSLYLKRKFGADGTVVNLFNVGDYITIRDAEIGVDKAIRIKEFTRNASTDPYDYKVTLSDVVEVSIIERLISDQIETDKIIEINNLTDLAKARANWRTTQELLNMVFDGDGYFDPTHIKPSSIETMMLSVGSRASQFVLQNIVITANSISGNKPNPNLITIQSNGGVLIHYAIEDKDRSWNIKGGSVTLTTDGAYYVYARCEKAGSTGSIIISQSKINVDDGNSAGYYHFVIGVISSIFNGYREVTLTYGATRITGRSINCGRIESIDKKTYFDLDNGEIGGKIRFTSGNGTDRLVSELEGDVNGHTQYLNALTSAVGSQGETLNGLTERVGEQGESINTLNDTLKAITDNYTEINGGLILSTFLKLGAILKNGNWTESAGLKAMLDNANEIAAYFGGTYAEALEGKDDMTVIYHNGKIKTKQADITGIINATSGKMFDVVYGKMRSPFIETDSWSAGYTDNFIPFSETGGWQTSQPLICDKSCSGRRICLCNPAEGSADIQLTDNNCYFYEDGTKKQEISLNREIVELIGYGTKDKFYGWIVLNRRDFLVNGKYGAFHKVMYQGLVNDGVMQKQWSYEGKYCKASKEGNLYRVTLPSSIGASKYTVILTGVSTNGTRMVYACLMGKYDSSFTVYTGDNSSFNDGGFIYQVISIADWV